MINPPENWIEIPLDALLLSLESGSRPKGGVRGIMSGVPSIGAEHLANNGSFDFTKIKYIPENFAQRMTKGHINENDILIVKDGATTGKVSFVSKRFPYKNAAVNEHVFICRPSSKINPIFLFHFLRSKEGRDRILNNFKGSAQGGINLSFAPNTKVVLAPLGTQNRIVAKLEKLLAKVDKCTERLEKIPAIIKRFRQSVLTTAFSGKLTEDWRNEHKKKFEWKYKVFEKIIIEGPQNGLYKPQKFYGSGYLIVRIDNFYDGTINPWDTLKKLKLNKKELNSYSLQNGDILVNRVNSMKYLGKSALVRNLSEKCVFESNMMRIKINIEKVHPEYLIKYLNSRQGLNELRKNAKHAVNQSSINQQDVKAVSIPLPSFEEQKEIISRIEALFKVARQSEARYQKVKAHVEKLTQSILAKAFRGELVPQDPSDPPASELLKQIKVEREKQQAEFKAQKNPKRKAKRKSKKKT